MNEERENGRFDPADFIPADAQPKVAVSCELEEPPRGSALTGIRITSARTRFGSCSGKNSLCFSWRLMEYPEEAIDYVVVHELAHLRYMNHGAEFYALIARYLPDWKTRRALLRA